MPIKLGTTNIILPYSKAYLGSKLVYQKSGYEDIEFTECPFPTEWTEVTKGTEYTATNDYGEWRIWADDYYSSSYYVYKGFDGDDDTLYRIAKTSGTEIHYAGIILPAKIKIKPTRFMAHLVCGANTILEGLNENGEWETLYLRTSNLGGTIDVDVDEKNFYSEFRWGLIKKSSTTFASINEFQITSGTIRKEN